MNIVIIEDDKLFCDTLEDVILGYFHEVNILGKASTVKEGVDLILKEKPDLILLDINLPDGTGFDILEMTKEFSFGIIYITAFVEYAEESYHYSALHFISKAKMSYEMLKIAFDRYSLNKSNDNIERRIEIAKDNFLFQPDKFKLKLKEGLIEIKFCNIIYCEANDNYTNIYLNNSKPIVSSKTLLHIEKLLHTNNFIRVHRSYILNLDFVSLHIKGINHKVLLSNSTKLPLSKSYKVNFINKYNLYKLENNQHS